MLVVQQELFAKDPDVVLLILSKKGTKMPEQLAWRFCVKCEAMFYDGFPDKGRCPAGGGHEAAGFNFVLPHDVLETPMTQADWRGCHKCGAMFFDGYPNKGICAAGGAHEPQGFDFHLPHG
jgi:hypothetical protein